MQDRMLSGGIRFRGAAYSIEEDRCGIWLEGLDVRAARIGKTIGSPDGRLGCKAFQWLRPASRSGSEGV
ncbi:hypothetical protein CKO23_08390 [Thiocystis violacea]|nr:hypothetical protein [Thiocystis violacea]